MNIDTPFAKTAAALAFTDKAGRPTDTIVAGETCVYGPWLRYTKNQVARVIGVVTEGMVNATNKAGAPVYKFHNAPGNWHPEGSVGDILMQDVDNPLDVWAVKPDLFLSSSGWNGEVDDDFTIIYTKPGKPHWAIQIPAGVTVETLEGSKTSEDGELLVLTKDGQKGDFFFWNPLIVETMVQPYIEPVQELAVV